MHGALVKKKSIDLLNGDTIVAIITPPGEGGIAALRLAGKQSLSLLNNHFKAQSSTAIKPAPFLMRLGLFVGNDKQPIDEITAVYMP
ncbi:MAG: hypothetical protein U9R56_03155, partial [candidate division Zixibacteria bacterium]|nr:hypothetical protein [candidate division Zixibacteria bacterium]